MKDTMTQVRLRSTVGLGGELMTWIPSKHAYVGVRMTVEDQEGLFEVMNVYDSLDADVVKKQQDYYRTHRKGTDI